MASHPTAQAAPPVAVEITDAATPAELEIPDSSYRAMLDAQDDWDDDDILANSIREVASPIVAAELRRLADNELRWSEHQAAILRARAAELDGGTAR